MIEELTPPIFAVALMLVLAFAPVLTLLLSALILWRYRRAVLRAMAASVSAAGAPVMLHTRPATATRPAVSAGEIESRLVRGPRLAALRCGAAGASFALVIAIAVLAAFPPMRSAGGMLVPLWISGWPIVLALGWTAPFPWRTAALATAVYAALLLVVSLPALLRPPEALTQGGEAAVWAASFTPPHLLRLWVVQDGLPSVLLLMFLNRWTRAIGPLVLGFVSTLVAGLVIVMLLIFSKAGSQLVVDLAVASGISVYGWLLGAAVATLAACALAGWAWLRWIRRGYLRKTLNDRTLVLDALWLLFSSSYAMWLALSGLAWAAAPLVAFAACKLVATPRRRSAAPAASRGLTFLRVFSLGRRSDRLLESVARHWRHVGSVQLITGPDVAHSTVQPHQLLDFVSGRLATHFIGDAASLERRIAERDTAPDRDGRHRINNLFCHADTWQAALARLVAQGDTVLMDLRSFGPNNAGCVFELRTLVDVVPMARCVLVIDDSTDRAFLSRTLDEAWQHVDARSPNRGTTAAAAPLHRLDRRHAGMQALLRRLAQASA